MACIVRPALFDNSQPDLHQFPRFPPKLPAGLFVVTARHDPSLDIVVPELTLPHTRLCIATAGLPIACGVQPKFSIIGKRELATKGILKESIP